MINNGSSITPINFFLLCFIAILEKGCTFSNLTILIHFGGQKLSTTGKIELNFLHDMYVENVEPNLSFSLTYCVTKLNFQY